MKTKPATLDLDGITITFLIREPETLDELRELVVDDDDIISLATRKLEVSLRTGLKGRLRTMLRKMKKERKVLCDMNLRDLEEEANYFTKNYKYHKMRKI